MERPTELPTRCDALVVGARAAGAATALLLARAGLRVLAVDRGREGEDTLSTHALMRAGVLQLARWGLLGAVEAAGTPIVRQATFHYGEEANPVAIKPRDGVEGLCAPRRTVLDPILVRAARAAGARVEHGVTALELLEGAGGRVRGAVLAAPDGARVTVEAPIVVGADGLRSRVAALVRAPVEREARHATAVIYGHLAGLEVDHYHWHFRPGASVGAIPTNDGRTCLFVAMPPDRFLGSLRGGLDPLYRSVLAEVAPGLLARLAAARLDGKLHPFPGRRGFMRRAHGPGWALVGDAGYFKDPLTAHGLTDALRDAELLARAVVSGTEAALEGYQAARDEASLALFEVTDRIASFEWDLGTVRELHHTLAKELAAEAELVKGLDAAPAPGTPVRRSGQPASPAAG